MNEEPFKILSLDRTGALQHTLSRAAWRNLYAAAALIGRGPIAAFTREEVAEYVFAFAEAMLAEQDRRDREEK